MMCGLQGSGKTTTTAKLARRLAAEKRRPLLVAADIKRPAAIDQLIGEGKRDHAVKYVGYLKDFEGENSPAVLQAQARLNQ
jgi:signal recognition particle subunit SRP54